MRRKIEGGRKPAHKQRRRARELSGVGGIGAPDAAMPHQINKPGHEHRRALVRWGHALLRGSLLRQISEVVASEESLTPALRILDGQGATRFAPLISRELAVSRDQQNKI